MKFNIDPFKKLRIYKGKSGRGKYYNYTMIKPYNNYALYRCKENGCLECFTYGSLLVMREANSWRDEL